MALINVRELAALRPLNFQPKNYEEGVEFLRKMKVKKNLPKWDYEPYDYHERNGMYKLFYLKGGELSSREVLNGACHAAATAAGQGLDMVATITHHQYKNAFVSSPLQITAEARYAYYDWLLNRSIYKDFFIKLPDEKFGADYGVMISGDLHPAIALTCLVMSRHCGERGAQVQKWFELVRDGVFDENTAFAVCLSANTCSDPGTNLFQLSSDHMIFSGSFSFKSMARWLRGDLWIPNARSSCRDDTRMTGVMVSTNGGEQYGIHWVRTWAEAYKNRHNKKAESVIKNPFVPDPPYGATNYFIRDFFSKEGIEVFNSLLNAEIAAILNERKAA